MQDFVVSPEVLAGIAGVIVSLAFSYIPGLNTAFAKLPAEIKRLIMAGLMLAAAAVIMLLGCYGIVSAGVSCDQQGVVQLVWIYITAVIANQSAYQITPQTSAVKSATAQAK